MADQAQLLILTKAQGDAIRGPTSPGNALDPVLITDGPYKGSYALGPEVLTDPAHKLRAAALKALAAPVQMDKAAAWASAATELAALSAQPVLDADADLAIPDWADPSI